MENYYISMAIRKAIVSGGIRMGNYAGKAIIRMMWVKVSGSNTMRMEAGLKEFILMGSKRGNGKNSDQMGNTGKVVTIKTGTNRKEIQRCPGSLILNASHRVPPTLNIPVRGYKAVIEEQ